MATTQDPVEAEIVEKPSPALSNPAIARCAKAWEDAYRARIENGGVRFEANDDAAHAYRAALPPLTNRDNCRDFIACVAHGMLLGAIPENNAGKLLYAAQVALGAVGAEEKSREMAGYAVYANLTEAETACVKKVLPQRSKMA
jgi:hypothetical protein